MLSFVLHCPSFRLYGVASLFCVRACVLKAESSLSVSSCSKSSLKAQSFSHGNVREFYFATAQDSAGDSPNCPSTAHFGHSPLHLAALLALAPLPSPPPPPPPCPCYFHPLCTAGTRWATLTVPLAGGVSPGKGFVIK